MKTFLINICLFLFLFVITYFGAMKLCERLDAPDVHVSYTTKQCVRIVTIQGQKLPCSEKANFKWLNYIWVE